MKLKCSPSANPSHSPHSTLKVVDHHHQLQQQHIVGHSSHISSPSPHHALPNVPMSLAPSAQSNSVSAEMILPTCLEYATTMDLCGALQQQDLVDLQWEHPSTSANGIVRNRNIQISNRDMCTGYTPPLSSTPHSMYSANMPQSGPINVPTCCSTYEPTCCSSGLTYGPNFFMPPASLQHQQQHLPEGPLSMLNDNDDGSTFAYHEPDENFISIDDAKIKGFLMKIGEKEQAKRDQTSLKISTDKLKNMESVVYEIIELEDEDALGAQTNDKLLTSSAPKSISCTTAFHNKIGLPNINYESKAETTSTKEKIVASIELLDSTDSEQDDEDLPLTAVTCELHEDNNDEQNKKMDSIENADVLQFDDEENVEFIDEQEEGVEVRWDDLEEQRERTFFECYLCGKKVQSSYNLRRHMMIHTGEYNFTHEMPNCKTCYLIRN